MFLLVSSASADITGSIRRCSDENRRDSVGIRSHIMHLCYSSISASETLQSLVCGSDFDEHGPDELSSQREIAESAVTFIVISAALA